MAQLNTLRKKKFKRKLFSRMLLSIIIAGIIISASLGIYLYNGVKNERFGRFPGYPELRKIENVQATEVFTSDSVLMGRYFYENRNSISYSAIPENVVQALIATEDERFYEHNGIDTRSLLRVFFKTILLGDRSSGGGSTITQQLAKNLYDRKLDGTISMAGTKVREMILARRIEKLYEKDKIIQLYLNTVPFGESTFGVKNASQLYFGNDPDKLSLNQAATLVGMLKATTTYNPHKFPEKSLQRRNVVLAQMKRNNFISKSTYDSLKTLSLNTNYHPVGQNDGIAPYFREYLRKFMEKWCESRQKPNGENYNLYQDGLKIYTTIHSELQESASHAVKKHMPILQAQFEAELEKENHPVKFDNITESKLNKIADKKGVKKSKKQQWLTEEKPMEIFTWKGPKTVKMSVKDSIEHYLKILQTGFTAIDPESGNILAWIGGIHHKYFKYDHVLSKRQMGSVFKPVVYARALENQVKPCDYYPNDSIVYEEFDNWTPSNADKKYGGVYSVEGALVHSVNTVSVQLLMETGIDSVIHLARKMGIHDSIPSVPSIALGTANASVLELARVYATFANNGKPVTPNYILRIEDHEGNVLESFSSQNADYNLLSQQTTEKITMMLNGVTQRGTGRSLTKNFEFDSDVAGKTGTTQNHSDGWFVGYTPDLVFSCWVGGEYPQIHFKDITYGQGAATALPVAGHFLQNLSDVHSGKSFTGNFTYHTIDTAAYTCLDYREKAPGLLEKVFNIKLFKKKETDEKSDKKKGLLKKIMGVFKNKKQDSSDTK